MNRYPIRICPQGSTPASPLPTFLKKGLAAYHWSYASALGAITPSSARRDPTPCAANCPAPGPLHLLH
ncbi:hypothetical protein SODALDRAFT_327721 [Sodiomyces alkalinus F11]|uniref:Uncharacterized protein n=1 Tax=Sodiomyces alkalinus (strain CBS 110278 / VKM F-3762 / F11) TaxID=1314773 RepID=A0A3N2QA41_SODAK|nr:hypothetical protein SODALDRAFT_327721 [Sodiomyces alkalinus F11]ROT43515.1 hypothetical protein SODALDRAFT_327721 [Sodiomyces alkalinus F11]